MSSYDIPSPSHADRSELNHTLYRYGLSLAVLFDLLVAKGILSREEIRERAGLLHDELWCDNRPEAD
ncbi:MAG: hypothetical protein OWU33_01550 [Firmicutes bacterium]|nr:hypothetical protein [Bacillota bacterium]